MGKLKVYVTDYEYATLEPEKIEFDRAGITMVPKQCKTEDDVIRECADAAGLLDQYAPITRKVIEKLPNLKAVGRYGVGVNTIDLDAATEHGVAVMNVPDYCMDEVSNQAIALMMALQRKLIILNDQVQHGGWDYKIAKPINRLSGQTIGLLGFGRIPRMVAEKVKAFGLHIVVYDPFVPKEAIEAAGAAKLSLEALLQAADIISVHAPLTKDTEGMIGKEQFALMKPNAIIINTSRGPLIDEQALYEAIRDKQIAGAGIDVTVKEPLSPKSPLIGLANVIITPHVAWYSEESELELKRKIAYSVGRVLNGEAVPNIVNRAVCDKLKLK